MTDDYYAWGDESIRFALDRPSYLLGAAVARPSLCGEYRDVLRGLLTRGVKLHWRDLTAAERDRVVDVVAELDLLHVVVVGAPVAAKRQERARALCLEHLAWELQDDGVDGLTLEARTSSLMRRDMKTIDSLRGKQALPRGLRVEHQLPSEEPMLWIADQVLGALGESMGGNARWFERLSRSTRIERIDL